MRTAQLIGLLLLIAALVLPPVVLIAAQSWVESPENLDFEQGYSMDAATV